MNFERDDRIAQYLEFLQQHPALRATPDVGLKLVLDAASIAEFEYDTGKVLGIFAENQYLLILHDLVENTAGDKFVYMRILNKQYLRGDCGVIVLPVERHTDGDVSGDLKLLFGGRAQNVSEPLSVFFLKI